MDEDLDPKYLSQHHRDLISDAKQVLADNPMTFWERFRYGVYVNVFLYSKVKFLRFKVLMKRFGL